MVKLGKIYTLVFKPLKPYSFKLTASAYNFNWWFNGSYLILPLGSSTISILRELNGEVKCTVYSSSSINRGVVEDSIAFHMGFYEDLSDFYTKICSDSLLRGVPLRLAGMRLRSTDPFNALLVAICQQNASFKQGWRMLMNIYDKYCGRVFVNGLEARILPSPLEIVNAGVEELRGLGVGYRAETIFEASRLLSELNLGELSINDFEERLLKIKGIGQYTSRLTLLFSRRLYTKPPIDRWVSRIASETYRVPVSGVEKFYTNYLGSWAGLGIYFLTIVLDAVPLRKAIERVKTGRIYPEMKGLTPLTLWMLGGGIDT
ncbi:MAG: hypothetical protein QW803_07780 [Candidatus Methanomethylicia archaeon]